MSRTDLRSMIEDAILVAHDNICHSLHCYCAIQMQPSEALYMTHVILSTQQPDELGTKPIMKIN